MEHYLRALVDFGHHVELCGHLRDTCDRHVMGKRVDVSTLIHSELDVLTSVYDYYSLVGRDGLLH